MAPDAGITAGVQLGHHETRAFDPLGEQGEVVLADRPSLSRLLATAIDQRFSEDERPADHTSWLFGQLTAEHTRRMGRLGLAA